MKKICIGLILFFWGVLSFAQNIGVYEQIGPDFVEAYASSSIASSPASNVVDGSGMINEMHVSNNLGNGMWVSGISTTPVSYAKGTHKGSVWFLCVLGGGEPVDFDQIRIWNHNQNEHTRRGLNKVYIEYSNDGEHWSLLKNGNVEYHRIPESKGRNPEPADYILDTPGMKAAFICITADIKDGNHYDLSNPIIVREIEDMKQNPAYYGLSEIGFYKKKRLRVESLPVIENVSFHASQGYLRTKDGPAREFYIEFDKPLYAGGEFTFNMGGFSWKAMLPSSPEGLRRYGGTFPVGYMEESALLNLSFESRQGSLVSEFDVPAARKWVVNFFAHSHQDIGYTHRQDDVMKLQWRNLERAMDLADRTKDYPEGAKYCWNTEATWSVMGYLEKYAGTEKSERLINAIRAGVINVDASLGSILTGISRQEELNHYFDDAHEIEKMTGVRCNTAMMSDVPGQVWGLATAMAKNGVRYYSPGPNYVPFYGKIGNDRAAAIHIKWGDRPFYWKSQSGKDSVLVWSAGRGYSWFHGWLAGRLSVCGLEPIWQYLTELEMDGFPYEWCYLRYTVHGDNGPPDELMPEIIKAWNEKYDSPQFRITTSKEFFTAFENKYGATLPIYGGDMTPTWEDGAASTARETAMNRESAARLSQAATLWSMLEPGTDFPFGIFKKAWKNIVLFSEHTWGAAGSGPEPDSKFTKDLWEKKKSFAVRGDSISRALFNESLSNIKEEGKYLHVINTNLWNRTDVVRIDGDLSNKKIIDAEGNHVPLQKLSDGNWAFIARDIPAMSSVVYTVVDSRKHKKSLLGNDDNLYRMLDGNVIDNKILRVVIDTLAGTISSLRTVSDDFEYAAGGLNDYIYSGRMAENPRKISGGVVVKIINDGPVAATLRVESGAPGCNNLKRDITLYRGIGRVDIINTLDKKDIRDFENIRFAFPFNFPHPEISLDMAMSEVHPEREQLAGVNKNYYSLQNGLSVGDLEHGICMSSIDAPFVEFGSPSGEDYRLNPRYGYGWWLSSQISPVIYSWVMTNTWRTNYKASQDGVVVFRYSLQPGNPHDLELKRFGAEREQGLIAVISDTKESVRQLFRLKGQSHISVSEISPSEDGVGYILKLQNLSSEPVHTSFVWGSLCADRVSECDWNGKDQKSVDPDSFWFAPYEYKVLKLYVKKVGRD